MEREEIAQTTDEELLRRAQAQPEGEESRQAACDLLSRYRDRVYAWCYRRLNDPDLALDMAQEVLLSAYRHLDSFEPKGRFSTWLFAITRNRCISELRRPSPFFDQAVDLERLGNGRGDPATLLAEKMSEEKLLGLIRQRLEPLEQEVLWLRCVERMPIERINQVMNIPQTSGARAVLQRARRKLRDALSGSGSETEVRP